MSRRSLPLVLAVLAGVLAGLAVADHRAGLALTVVLASMLGAGVAGSPRPRSRTLLVLAAALAVQPLLLDAQWVVALGVLACLVAAAAGLAPATTWAAVGWALLAPLRLDRGVDWVARRVSRLPWLRRGGHIPGAVLRGVAAAAVLLVAFGALFLTADSAFAQLAVDAVSVPADPADLGVRVVLGLVVLLVTGALIRAGAGSVARPARSAPWAPGRTETRIAVGALVALFALFVAVQLRVLFGGADYVRATTGLGFGDYARQGFFELLLVAALTLAVVAVAARADDRRVRVLLGALCLLTLVVLASALHRLDLVIDAYGLTRVRYTGVAAIAWLAAVFALVLVAGARPRVRVLAPRIVLVGSAAAALAFALSNPDARIAASAVDRQASTGRLDERALRALSADAVPALRRLPEPQRSRVLRDVRRRLEHRDGVAGFNVSRWSAR